ncbi:unnamed protein product, partial [Didymodactylos carnosus]
MLHVFLDDPNTSLANPWIWSIEQVIGWLQQNNFQAYIDKFRDEKIDGATLLSDGLDDSILKELMPPVKQRVLFKEALIKL